VSDPARAPASRGGASLGPSSMLDTFVVPRPATLAAEGEGEVSVRYDDVAQDGSLKLETVPQAVGEVAWKKLVEPHPLAAFGREHGVIPILSRAIAVAGDGPVSVHAPLVTEAAVSLSKGAEPGGEQRLYLNMWGTVRAPRGSTWGPRPDAESPLVSCGRQFLEHVMTRPFGPASERRVRSLELPGLGDPFVESYAPPPSPASELGLDATPLGVALLDDVTVVLGLEHTDSNQHVNSLVHPRLFYEAALRLAARVGRSPRELAALRARAIDIAYRRPVFAGEGVRVRASVLERDGELLVQGRVLDATSAEGAAPRTLCEVRLLLAPRA
jgi:acyl-CoA thioesterase FadM